MYLFIHPTTGDALHAVHFAGDGRGHHAQGAGTTRGKGREGGREGGRVGRRAEALREGLLFKWSRGHQVRGN